MTTVMNKVISTPELLEAVLREVDMRTLLTSAQLVCHQWHHVITKSPSIQQALFFRPAEDASSLTKRIKNSLLAELFPPWFPPPDAQHGYDTGSIEALPLAKKKDAYLRKGASWRRMLVQQPPVQSLGILHTTFYQRGATCSRRFLKFNDGLRMDGLYDLVQQQLGELVNYPFWVIWWEIPSAFIELNFQDDQENVQDDQVKMLEVAMEKSEVVLHTAHMQQCTGKRQIEWIKQFTSEDCNWPGLESEDDVFFPEFHPRFSPYHFSRS